MKQLSASTPNALHDLLPKVEQIAKDLADLPGSLDQTNHNAAMEEALGQNVERAVKAQHEATWAKLAEKFETMDHR